MSLKSSSAKLSNWQNLVRKIKHPKRKVSIGLVGKYVHLRDSYQSIHEALVHGGLPHQIQVNVEYINSEKNLSSADLDSLSGVLVPGGFGDRGIDGKIKAIQHCRENSIPFFGICLGMQMAAVEFGRNVCGIKDAVSREFEEHKKSKNFVVDYMPDQKSLAYKGGNMRLGSYPCLLVKNSKTQKIYNKDLIHERHRHRYEFNFEFAKKFEEAGMKIAGKCKDDNKLVEILEIPKHPWFIGVQFHPEFQSKPTAPHPLFVNFIKTCKNKAESFYTDLV